MKYIYTIIASILLIPQLAFAQNLVPNSSFEDLDASHPNSPTDISQLQHLTNWKNFNTADLNSEEVGKENGVYLPNYEILPAHTGTKYIGFGPCEGAQIKLNQKILKERWVTVSFWYSPRNFFDSEINVYLLENQAPDNALEFPDGCYNPNIEFEAHFTVDVKANNAFGAAQHVPGQWYFYQSEPQLVVDKDYEWFAIKGINETGAAGDNKYIFVDDVSVESFGFCEHLCTGGGVIELTSIIPDGAIGNNGQENFYFTIKNANQLEVSIFNVWGEEAFYWKSYDVNGLVDPGYTDFAFVWNGHSTLTGGDVLSPQVYTVKIDARSCASALPFIYDGGLTLGGIVDPPAVIYAETINRIAQNCCIENQYYQNVSFTGYDRTDVNDFIIAGSNVTSGTPGPVIVESGANVEFHAGNFISITTNDFIINQGGLFSATIEPCASSPKSLSQGGSMRDFYEQARNATKAETTRHEITIVPNPNRGSFTINGLNPKYHNSLTLYDMLGNEMYSSRVQSLSQEVSLPKITEGVYLLHVIGNDGIIETHKIMIL